ncbi:MAG: hypothetical protein ABSD10_01560 [Candidatus Saccharimonadales bacterium]|jgi:hypothetical protein
MASLYDITKGEDVELYRILSQSGLDAEMARALIKQPELVDPMVAALKEQLQQIRFDRYRLHLLSLEDQLNLWQVLDLSVLDGQIKSVGWFDTVDTSSDHVQSVNDLEIFYIEFGSSEGNVEAYWRAIKANQPNARCYDGLKIDSNHLRLTPTARWYEPGIHRIRINLVAHWEPEDGRSVLQVREQAARTGETLAAAEVLAAYAVHDELLRQQDGTNLPYADMAGFEATVPDDQPWTSVLYLYGDRVSREVGLDAGWADRVRSNWAAPVVRES